MDLDDLLDFNDYHVDINGNDIPDLHEAPFIATTDDASVPDVINGSLDRDGDGVPDQHDSNVELHDSVLDWRTHVDSGSDGMNDWGDPFSRVPNVGLSPELRHELRVQLTNPFYR